MKKHPLPVKPLATSVILAQALPLVLQLFLVASLAPVPVAAQSQGPSWWDNNWPYRRAITISGSHPENYQLKIVLPFFDNSLRFTENENGPLLPYWVENYTSNSMTVWVRRFQANGTDNTIFVYYGNQQATRADNGDSTFMLFDDFLGPIDASKWTVSGSPSASGGILTIPEGTSVQSTLSFGSATLRYRAYIGLPNLTGAYGIVYTVEGGLSNGNQWAEYCGYSNNTSQTYKIYNRASINQSTDLGAGYTGYHIWEIRWVSGGSPFLAFYIDDSLVYAPSEIPYQSLPILFSNPSGTGTQILLDWVLVRASVSSEPSATVGAPEALTPLAVDLKTENQLNPTRISTYSPTLSVSCSVLNSTLKGENLQIQVASDNGFAGILWSTILNYSPPIGNNQAVSVTYSGPPLSRGVTYYWRGRWYSGGYTGTWSEVATFRIADMQITSVGTDSTLVDRKRDWNARDNVTISVRIREEGADAPLTCKLSIRDSANNILLDNLSIVDRTSLDSENVLFTYAYNPPDDLPDDALGPFEVRTIAEDNLGSRIWDWTQMFTVDDIRVSAGLEDNTPIYKIELSGNAFRIYDNASTTLDNVVVVDNNEGEIQATFSENSFSKAYGLVSPVRLRHGDLGQIYVVARDDVLDGRSPILTYQVEGDNLRILNPIPTRYADRTEVVFDARWASDGTSVGYGTVCLPENSQISCQVSNGWGTLVIPHSAKVNSGNKALTCPDDADRPIWAILSQGFPFNILPWAEDLRADNRTLPARVTPSPVFSWAFRDNNPNDSQLAFRIQVGSTPDNNDVWDYTGSGSANSVGYGGQLARGQTYYVRMIVEDTYGEWQNTENADFWTRDSFTVNRLPTISSLLIRNLPAPIFEWAFSDEDGDTQAKYQIQIGTSENGSDVWDYTGTGSENTAAYSQELQPGTYYVRVRVFDNLEWSGWKRASFRVIAPPTLLSPENGGWVSLPATVSWSHAENLYFLAEISEDPDFSGTVENSGWSSSTSWVLQSLPNLSTRYWRVRAMDLSCTENRSGWSPVLCFRVDNSPPTQPGLLSPSNGSTLSTSSVALSWGSATDEGAGVDHYELWVSGSTYTVSGTSQSLSLANGSYSWRVRAVDAVGNAGPWSEEWSFTVSVSAPSGGGGAGGGGAAGRGTGGENATGGNENIAENVQENIDRSPPRIEILKLGPENTVYVLFRVWDESRVSSVLSWLDNQPTPIQSAEGGLEVRVENVPEGIHSILIRAVDNFGNENLLLLTYTVKKPSPPLRVTLSVKENILMIDIQNTQNRALSLTLQVYVDGRYYTMVSLDLDALAELERTMDLSGLGPGEHQVEVRDSEGNLLAKSLLFVPAVRAQPASSIPLWSLAIPLGSAIAVSVGLGVRSGRLGIFIRRKRTPPTPVKAEEIPEVLRSLAPLLKEEKDD